MTEYIVDIPEGNAYKIVKDGWHVRVECEYKQRGSVVRCRDCKHYDEDDAGCNYFVLAKNNLLHIKNHDGFCAWGERKDVQPVEVWKPSSDEDVTCHD